MPNVEWKYAGPDVDEKCIVAVEQALSVKLPADYISVIRTNNGSRPRPNVLDIRGRPEAVFHSLLRLGPSQRNNVIEAKRALSRQTADNLVPFGQDPFGNLFCFRYEEPRRTSCEVVFWDHEQKCTTWICRTFQDLVAMLHEPTS